jgi:uncharacterized protein (DUF58 family)
MIFKKANRLNIPVEAAPLEAVSLRYLVGLRLLGRAIRFPPRLKSAAIRAGQVESLQRGRGIDFDEVRRYQTGDDIRAMDWRVLARTGQPHTRLYHEEREQPVSFWMDYHTALYFGTRRTFKFVAAAEAAALLAWSVAAAGESVSGTVFDGTLSKGTSPVAGNRGVLHFLYLLDHYQPDHFDLPDPDSLMAARKQSLFRFESGLCAGQCVVLLSDFTTWKKEELRHIESIARRTQGVLVQVSDPVEMAPPQCGNYSVSNGEAIINWSVDQGAEERGYYLKRKQHLAELEAFCGVRAIRWIETQTDHSPEHFAARFLASGRNQGVLQGALPGKGRSVRSGRGEKST